MVKWEGLGGAVAVVGGVRWAGDEGRMRAVVGRVVIGLMYGGGWEELLGRMLWCQCRRGEGIERVLEEGEREGESKSLHGMVYIHTAEAWI